MKNLEIKMCYFYHLMYDKKTKEVVETKDQWQYFWITFLEDEVQDRVINKSGLVLMPGFKEIGRAHV